MSDELVELRKISKILTLVNAEVLEKELSKYATTNERKKAWILIDGNKTTEQIGQLAGMKVRTIQDFLKILTDASLIELSRPPKRIIDYVPASWLNLVQPEIDEKKQEATKDVKTTAN
jgi:hypothetical protein